MGLKHDQYWRNGKTQMSDVYLSILHSLGVEEETFADSTKRPARARSSPRPNVAEYFQITTPVWPSAWPSRVICFCRDVDQALGWRRCLFGAYWQPSFVRCG